ncbi:MAG: hypothetical protein IH591_01190 [Bacteroidales bacterium]|nr:hypothetical protein [Bacteroidales bacterium]
MKILYIICLSILLTIPVRAQNEKSEILQTIIELKQDIVDLENEIREAEDPEEIADLKRELGQLKRSLSILETNKSTLLAVVLNPDQFEDAYMFDVPKNDKARIDKVPPEIKNNTQIEDHIKSTAREVDRIVPAEIKSTGLQLSNAVKGLKTDSVTNGDLAVGFWIMGNPHLGLYMQSLACKEDPLRVDWLNNYASMLTMMGGEELALPILQRINNELPNNSITLNNIGMAWYGLGELNKAEKYLDSAMIFPGNHSQAKMAKALIEEKKGNKQNAEELVKESLGEGYSQDKEMHLEKMGIEPDGTYIRGTDELKDEYLGLQSFINQIPEYPKSAASLERADMEWLAFKEKLSAGAEVLEQKIKEYDAVNEAAMEEFLKGQMEHRIGISPFAVKYMARNMNTLIIPTMDEIQRKPSQIISEFMPDFMEMDAKRQKLTEYLKNNELSEDAICRAVSEYLYYANGVRENYNNAFMRFWKRMFNTMAQYHKYYITPTPETYQLILMNLEQGFISELRLISYETWGVGATCNKQQNLSGKTGPLPLFEDIKCDRHSEMYIPVVGIRIVTNCHYMESSFDPYIPLPLELKIKIKDDLLTGQNVGGSVTVGGRKSVGRLTGGPGKLDITAGANVTVEWDSNGISDVSATVELKSQVGTNVTGSDGKNMEGIKSVTLGGVSQTISLASGPSTQFKSSFK